MKNSDLTEIIQQGENSAVEFKSADVKTDSLAKEIIAFANMNGGIILIGIEDDRTISGVSKEKNWEEWTMNIVRNNINPPINICFQYIELNEKIIACITVEKGKNKPYQTIDGKYYIRIGSTNRIASIVELMRLFQESGAFHYDLCKVEKTKISDLSFTKLDTYFSKYGVDFSLDKDKEKLLVNTDIMTEEGNLTVGGLLIFGINPQRYLYNSYIVFAHFNGNIISDELIDKQNIEGTIDMQVDLAVSVIKNNLLTPSKIIGLKREHTKHIHEDKVFREIVLNAVVHRNYAILGSSIRIFLFHDRLEVISPGKLPNTVTLEKIRAGVSYSRNLVILKYLENLRYIDKLGRGIPMIINETQKAKKNVFFEEIGEEFKVTLEL
jgi:ATP-dependent DNA helicase RecG